MDYTDDSWDTEGEREPSDDEVLATIFALFATGLNPAVDRVVAFDLTLQAIEEGGLSIQNAHDLGQMLRRATVGMPSKSRH